MPELPDIADSISALESRIAGQLIERVRLASAFLLRTYNRRLQVWKAGPGPSEVLRADWPRTLDEL